MCFIASDVKRSLLLRCKYWQSGTAVFLYVSFSGCVFFSDPTVPSLPLMVYYYYQVEMVIFFLVCFLSSCQVLGSKRR